MHELHVIKPTPEQARSQCFFNIIPMIQHFNAKSKRRLKKENHKILFTMEV